MWLRPRPGPPLPRLNKDGSVWAASNGNGNGNGIGNGNGNGNGIGNGNGNGAMRSGAVGGGRGGDTGNWRYIAYSWKGLWKTILRARRLKDVMLFLAAWFMISDGVATVSGTAILFAKTVSADIIWVQGAWFAFANELGGRTST